MGDTTPKPDTTAAATDVPEFVSDLDGGQFERALSIALSQVAAATVDRESKKGEVTIKLKMEHIKGTSQVRIAHVIAYRRPTMTGKAAEDMEGATVMHVGRYGRLTIAQPSLLDKAQGKLDV